MPITRLWMNDAVVVVVAVAVAVAAAAEAAAAAAADGGFVDYFDDDGDGGDDVKPESSHPKPCTLRALSPTPQSSSI